MLPVHCHSHASGVPPPCSAEDEVVGMPPPIEEEVAELPPAPALPQGTTGLKNIGEGWLDSRAAGGLVALLAG